MRLVTITRIKDAGRLVVYFSLKVLGYNLALSVMAAVFSLAIRTVGRGRSNSSMAIEAVVYFVLSFLTVGYLLSLLLYRKFRYKELPMYFNRGIGFGKLCGAAYFFCILAGSAAVLLATFFVTGYGPA